MQGSGVREAQMFNFEEHDLIDDYAFGLRDEGGKKSNGAMDLDPENRYYNTWGDLEGF